MTTKQVSPLRIGIIGAGFSGISVAASIHRLSTRPVEIFLFEKKGVFAVGEAYRTPFAFHLLNVKAKDMSAFEDAPQDFVDWLAAQTTSIPMNNALPLTEQYAPRQLYGIYLNELLQAMQADTSGKIRLHLEPHEVVDVKPEGEKAATLILRDHRKIQVDKVVLALGNNQPSAFPFPVSEDIHTILNPWDYKAPEQIEAHDPVLIIGTGLSMIDAVLTLHHLNHKGKIYALSRHGLLPLPHAEHKAELTMTTAELPQAARELTTYLRNSSQTQLQNEGDWRAVMTAVRPLTAAIWSRLSLADKKLFLRHLLPYWNIHRHRVHDSIAALLDALSEKQQLTILAGRVLAVEKGKAQIRLRHSKHTTQLDVKWLINCMGPSLIMSAKQQPAMSSLLECGLATLDALKLGFAVTTWGGLKSQTGTPSTVFYSLGPPTKGETWECGAVPDIRKQSYALVRHLLDLG